MRRAAGALAGIAILLPLSLTGAAQAAPPHWRTADFPFQEGVNVLAADLAADGDAIVALTLGPQLAVLERRGPRGPWGGAVALTTTNGDRSVTGRPIVRVNERGEALAVWVTAPAGRVIAARRPAGGRWAAGVTVGIGNVVNPPGLVRAALGDDGRAWITASSHVRGTSLIQAVGQGAAGGDWTPLASDLYVGSGDVAVNRRGEAVVAWGGPVVPGLVDNVYSAVFASTLGPGGWGPQEVVRALPPLVISPEIAVGLGDDGRAALAWTLERVGVAGRAGLETAIREPGGPWSAPVISSPSPMNATDPAVAVGADGDALAAWRELTYGTEGVARAAIAPRGGDFAGTSTVVDSVREAFSRPVTPFVASDEAVLVAEVERAGSPAAPVAFGSGVAGAPAWRSLGVPSWLGSDRVFAFAATGAGLGVGTIDQPASSGSSRDVLRIESYDAGADPPRPRVSRVALVRTARGLALALTLSRPARMTAEVRFPGAATPGAVIGPRSLRAGRHLLPVRGLTPRRYRIVIRLCTSVTGCEDTTVAGIQAR